MKLLALETSTEACSVALWLDGELHVRHAVAPRQHAELALPWCDALLAETGVRKRELDAIAVGRGPGAFTGVRLAVALAQGMALALDVPVLPVSTLAALALGSDRASEAGDVETRCLLAAIDARMGEVYLGLFRRDGEGIAAIAPEWMARPEQVEIDAALLAGAALIGAGTGFVAAQGVLRARLGARLTQVDAERLPHAADVARLGALAWDRGEAIPADRLEPAYLRERVALTVEERSRGERL